MPGRRQLAPGPASPSGGQNGDVVLLAAGIPGDQRVTLALRLRDEHPVERVPVDQRKAPGGNSGPSANGQLREAAAADSLGQVSGLPELADGLLDRDLPHGGGADVDTWLMVEPVLDLLRQ